ncbi:transporter substrate-binding domain-containing protein [Methylobacillus glycogenes]|uniref:transporter substrate-binding domain-containing protein n=1 Tax=Methylobacillus glycogenes TaxID=406 RepID=UPI000684B1A2
MLKMQCQLVMLSALFALTSWLSAAQAESLTVVGDENYPPYLFKDDDGNTVGYLVDLWDLWQQKTGVEVNLVPTAWVNAQARVLHGDADVIEMLYRTPKREALYTFSQPMPSRRWLFSIMKVLRALPAPAP